MAESEKRTEAYLKQRIRGMGGKCFKMTDERGLPDQLCVLPNGFVAWVEVKSEGKKPEKHQLRSMVRLRKMGHFAVWIDKRSDVDQLIKTLKRMEWLK